MNKKFLITISIISGIVLLFYLLIHFGVITPETFGANPEAANSAMSVYDLENGCYYVWHNENETDIKKDLTGPVGTEVFRRCPSGDINWKKNSFVKRTLWFTTANDVNIPTYYPGDVLLYLSSTYVPSEGISWERFADYGYTIGVSNLEPDQSGHYRIINSGDTGYAGYIYPNSDAAPLETYTYVSNIFLDKIGSVQIRDKQISEGGTVLGLKKDASYVCEWYTGTYYQDYRMHANVRAFGSMEAFTTYEYEFLHSNCIAITIPEWLKTGYYYLDGLGFFRYLAEEDAALYNDEAYDPNINWNDPIIIYDEEGNIIYNPIPTQY